MPTSVRNDELSKRQYVLVILRLLLDEESQLVHGEVIDEQGKRRRRFQRWPDLAAAVQAWLADQKSKDVSKQSNL